MNLTEIIIDNDKSDLTKGTFKLDAAKHSKSTTGFGYKNEVLKNGDHPFADGTAVSFASSGKDDADAKAQWLTAIPADGTYAVYVSYASAPNSSEAAHYRINAADGSHDFSVNQQMGGGTWIYLGHFPFKASDKETALVELFNDGKANTTVSADAVKIGGGMGNVARIVENDKSGIPYEYITSGYPRFVEVLATSCNGRSSRLCLHSIRIHQRLQRRLPQSRSLGKLACRRLFHVAQAGGSQDTC